MLRNQRTRVFPATSKLAGLQIWAGDKSAILAIGLTDITKSTELLLDNGQEILDSVLDAHFRRGASLAKRLRGRRIKTMGDSNLSVFKSAESCLDWALGVQEEPGHQLLRDRIRAVVHVGAVTVTRNDVFGESVILASRMIGQICGPELWLSNLAKRIIDGFGAEHHAAFNWTEHCDVELKDLGPQTLWELDRAMQRKPPRSSPRPNLLGLNRGA